MKITIVFTKGHDWTVAEYHFGDKRWINLLGEIKVTHWMPIPEIKKGE